MILTGKERRAVKEKMLRKYLGTPDHTTAKHGSARPRRKKRGVSRIARETRQQDLS